MTSEAKIRANRRNAQKSTGPRAPEGKAIARLNALKHGLLSKEVILDCEDKDEFTAFRSALTQYLNPQGELEALLVDALVANIWRYKRALRVESAYADRLYGEGQCTTLRLARDTPMALVQRMTWGQVVTGYTDTTLLNLIRYITAIERQVYNAMHELRRLQSERRGEPQLPFIIDAD